MKNQKKNHRELDKACVYCENAAPLNDPDRMLCEKYGVVYSGHVCRKFSYDPLKRIPAPRQRIDTDTKLPELP